MKKIIALSLALLVLPMVAFASLDTNLYYGVKNQSQVRELQEFLIDKGLLTGEATGNFYSLTLKAVKKYQESQSLPQTGYVGTMTRGAINQELATLLVDTEAELALEPAVEVAQPTQPVVTQSYGSPVPQQSAPIVESKKDIVIESSRVGECVLLKAIILDDDGVRLTQTRYSLKVTADTYPNRVSYIGILDDNNDYLYCDPEGEKHLPANILFNFINMNLKKSITVTP